MLDEWSAYMNFRPRFAEVMDERFYTIPWLDDEVYAGRARVWAKDASAIIATLKTYPTGAVEVHGLLAVGELDGVRALIPLAEAWGKRCGAIVAGIDSREGWQRALKADGYSLYQLGLRKEL